MRITCPGCGSAYDVPERAVPDPGRDVQCAACGESWYLLKGGAPPRAAGQAAHPAPARHDGADRSGDRQAATQKHAQPGATTARPAGGFAGSQPGGRAEDRAGAREMQGPDAAADADAVDGLPPRRVDPAVLAILRAEAETERRARAATETARAHPPPEAARDAAAPAPAPGPAPVTGGGMAGARDGPESAVPPSSAGKAAEVTGRMAGDPAGHADARGRLARLTAAERSGATNEAGSGAGSQGAAAGWATPGDDMDHGLVEDPDPARHGPRPPLLGAALADRPARDDDARGLPVAVTPRDDRALVVLEHRRRGFRLGFAATAGLCCAALAVYLLALRAGAAWDGPVLDAVRHHGGQVQAALVDWLRRVVVPALS